MDEHIESSDPAGHGPIELLEERRGHLLEKRGDRGGDVACDTKSVAGAVSQRACVYSGARVVLNPIADAAHIVHGPIGCATYTWDIRGSLSSGPQEYRMSFSTDMREKDVIFGGEKKLAGAIREVVKKRAPAAIFVYSTCIVGIIGDDIKTVCREAEAELGLPVIPVQSEGFKGNKSDGYRAACDALFNHVIGREVEGAAEPSGQPIYDAVMPSGFAGAPAHTGATAPRINIFGEFNIAGDLWEVLRYFEALGVEVVSSVTGDGRFADIARAHTADLNIIQCSGSLTYLAKLMKKKYGIPFEKVSFFGLEDMSAALMTVARHFNDPEMIGRAASITSLEETRIRGSLEHYLPRLEGRRAAVYMGGPAKALSLVKAFRDIGMEVVVIGTQSAKKDDYQRIANSVAEGTVIIDDANPIELRSLLHNKGADIMVGGVKERYLAYKLGVPFCDFNHDRELLFAGYDGMLEFAREVDNTIHSPVWIHIRSAAYRASGQRGDTDDH